MKRAAIVAVAGACLLLFAGGASTTSASTAAGKRTYWLTGHEAALPAHARGDTLASVSCASDGNCTAVGRYVDQTGEHQGLLLTETAGRWARGKKAALPSNAASASAILDSVSCVSAGDCTAVGTYGSEGLLLTKTAGVWAPGVEAALPTNDRSAEAVLLDVSCASAGNCVAVGAYGTFPPDRYGCPGTCSFEGLLLSETDGVWSKGVEAPLPADAAPTPDQLATVTSVSCPSPGNCSAVGSYYDVSSNYHGMLLTETAGTWATGVEAPLPASATGDGAGTTVSCVSAGNCTAVGAYADSSGYDEGLLLTETAGTWAEGVEAALPSNAYTTSQDASLGSVACTSPGNCTAVGSYLDGTYDYQGLLLTETDGVWSRGVEAALPGNALTTGDQTVYLNSLSCASAGNCTVAGEYVDRSRGGEGLLLTETAGRWAAGLTPALPAVLHNVRFTSVSCSSVGNCGAVGAAFDSRGRFVGLLLDSTSTPPCVVPRLKAKTLDAAKSSIRSHACSPGKVEYARSPNIRRGHVISQTPRPGARVRRGTKVDLVVSKGRN